MVANGSDNEQVELLSFAELCDVLGHRDDEFVSVCQKPVVDQRFCTSVLAVDDAAGFAELLSRTDHPEDRRCVWFAPNPTRGPAPHQAGRGTERDVTRWAATLLDLDVKQGAFDDIDEIEKFVDSISEKIGTRPSVDIFSGNGVQPLWVIEDGELDTDEKFDRAYRLSRRFGRLAATVAWREFGKSIDNVSDLCRVTRVPGSFNWKSEYDPKPVGAMRDSGGPLTVDQIEEVLDEWGPELAPELPSDTPARGVVVSAPDDWRYAGQTCNYVAEMVRRWNQESDRPQSGRHQWAMNRCVRLACAHRLGCITEDGLATALEYLEASLEHWCQVVGKPRGLSPNEVRDAYDWAQRTVATFDEERVQAELGNHPHPRGQRFTGDGEKTDSQERSWQHAGTGHEDFWGRTEVLRHVHTFARARMMAPWGVLGALMVRVVTTVPPRVQIPGFVGERASLNLYVGLVGGSGEGKGRTEGTARVAVTMAPIYKTGPGSGEGINHLFARYDKDAPDNTEFHRDAVWFSVPEVDTLGKLGDRNGSTLLEKLRMAWSGENLTNAWVDKLKHLVIPDHSYRLCMTVGVQPERAGVLLDNADAGTPQRFVWLPMQDPDAPDTEPPEPAPLDRKDIATGWNPLGVTEVAFPQHVEKQVRDNRRKVLRGHGNADNKHLMLCRIKVAAALALLHGHREVSDEMWELSAVVMEVSQATRAGVEQSLAKRIEQRNQARGKAEGLRAVEVDNAREDAAVKRVAQGIVRRLQAKGGRAPRSEVRPAARDRLYYDEAIERLVSSGAVKEVSGERGVDLVLTEGRGSA